MEEQEKYSQFEFLWPVRVYYEDTDAGGVVYHANYLNFLERARTECLRSWQLEQDILRNNEGIVFAVNKLNIHYDKPAKFNDALEIKTTITKLGKVSIDFNQDVYNIKNNEKLCSAKIKIACLNAEEFCVQVIPQNILTIIKSKLTTV